MKWVWPDFLNLGLAPPTPRGATAVAPRVALVPPFSIHDAFTRVPRSRSPMVLPSMYLLPAVGTLPGEPFAPTGFTPLTPNPYTDNGG
jgi:hypothetical protein